LTREELKTFIESRKELEGGFPSGKARVRGIYSTALTKLLLDNGFEIVQPSAAIKERFGLVEGDESPDLDIHDRYDWQGVHASGKTEAIDPFVSMLRCCFDDVITRKWPVTVHGIYKGLTKGTDSKGRSIFVDVGPATGKVDCREIQDPIPREVVVQAGTPRLGAGNPILTTRVKVPGHYAILVLGGQVKVSRKIRGIEGRCRLFELAEALVPSRWGIFWRVTADEQPSETLRREVAYLLQEGEGILKGAGGMEAPALVREGDRFVDVEFPALSKKGLDDVRKSVAPTMNGHHYYKACGEKVSSALEMAEKLLEKKAPPEDVEELFTQTIEIEYPSVGSTIGIEHVKLDGKVFHLGEATVEAMNENDSSIRFSRVFRREGTYDGLKTPKEPGDYAITEARIGEWFLQTRYFSKDRRYKGTYINLNTPVELYPHGIRYVDLEVDVCMWPDGRVEKLDEEKLEKAASDGLVTKKLVRVVEEKTRELLKSLCSG